MDQFLKVNGHLTHLCGSLSDFLVWITVFPPDILLKGKAKPLFCTTES